MLAGNDSITLVATDVQGSTELWEWNNRVMMEAINLHDRIMRSQISKFDGYEVATEGDAFVVAFHNPGKAVAWAAAMQQVCTCGLLLLSMLVSNACSRFALLASCCYMIQEAGMHLWSLVIHATGMHS